MSYSIDYGPKGTTLIQVGEELYLAYTDPNSGVVLYWTLGDDISNISDAPTGTDPSEIEGYQPYTEEQWKALEDSGQVWFSGSIMNITDPSNSFIIENAVSAVQDAVTKEPWSNDSRFLNLITELIIEDPANWVANLELDVDGRFVEVLNDYGYSRKMYNNYRTYRNDELGKRQLIKESKNAVLVMLQGLESNLDENSIDYVTNKIASGAWGEDYALQQITGATQKGSIFTPEDDFQNVLDNGVVTWSTQNEDKIQELLDTWLPEELHTPYLQEIAIHAGRYTNNPDYAEELIEKLKDERYAFNSSWDKEIPWMNIEGNGMKLLEDIWGVVPTKDDPTLATILSEPDVGKRKQIARTEGINRGYVQPTGDMIDAMMTTWNDGIVPTQNYTSGRRP